jgi:glucosyl-dolichyl phosphate glucuronosyltransferase
MLTVVMATKNRAVVLPKVLDAFAGLNAPTGGWKLVVVNNGSMDETAAILRSFADRLPLQILHEPKSGMNAALNAALGAVEGDLLVKADDDILPCRDWLEGYRRAADKHPEFSLFGGTVEPEFPSPPPSWLTAWAANFGILYARCIHAEGPCALSAIYGPNWAVRASVFQNGVRFNETIGPDSTQAAYPMGGETEFFLRLERDGVQGWFAPGAAIRHIVRPDQMQEGWILARSWRNGLGVGMTRPPRCAKGPRIAHIPLGVLVRYGVYCVLAGVARPAPRSALRLAILFRASWFAGLVAAYAQAPASLHPALPHAAGLAPAKP